MKKKIKFLLKGILNSLFRALTSRRIGRVVTDQLLTFMMKDEKSVCHGSIKLKFAVPNSLNLFRTGSFSDKEPETLEWIDQIPEESILWDVGANIGLYSCYAAKSKNCMVYAFEPSVFNLELLARNANLNKLNDKIVFIPLPLTSALGVNTMNMTSTEWGGALSTFGEKYGWDGKEINSIFDYQILGVTGDYIAQAFGVPLPDFIKIDVDGIEHMVLSGMQSALRNAKSVLVEVNDDFEQQAEQCNKILNDAGFILKEKRHSEMFASSESFGGGKVWNQIWIKNQLQS